MALRVPQDSMPFTAASSASELKLSGSLIKSSPTKGWANSTSGNTCNFCISSMRAFPPSHCNYLPLSLAPDVSPSWRFGLYNKKPRRTNVWCETAFLLLLFDLTRFAGGELQSGVPISFLIATPSSPSKPPPLPTKPPPVYSSIEGLGIRLASLVASVPAMNSASVVLNATVRWTLVAQDIGDPCKINT